MKLSETKLYWALGDRELLQEESGSSSTAESKSSRAVLAQIGKELRKEDDSQIPAESFHQEGKHQRWSGAVTQSSSWGSFHLSGWKKKDSCLNTAPNSTCSNKTDNAYFIR